MGFIISWSDVILRWNDPKLFSASNMAAISSLSWRMKQEKRGVSATHLSDYDYTQ